MTVKWNVMKAFCSWNIIDTKRRHKEEKGKSNTKNIVIRVK